MTNTTIPPLTEADVRALGFTRFGREREDDRGGSLAHRDGEAFYMQRAVAFWSVDPEYGNMRNVLCEAPPNWRTFRAGCSPSLIGNTDLNVLLWRVSDLPADRLALLFNHVTIAPVLAGLKAQAESTVKNLSETKVTPGDWAGNAPTEPDDDPLMFAMGPDPRTPAPTKRRPLVVGDRVMSVYRDSHAIRVVKDVLAMLSPHGYPAVAVALDDGTVTRDDGVYLILPREGE